MCLLCYRSHQAEEQKARLKQENIELNTLLSSEIEEKNRLKTAFKNKEFIYSVQADEIITLRTKVNNKNGH